MEKKTQPAVQICDVFIPREFIKNLNEKIDYIDRKSFGVQCACMKLTISNAEQK